MSNYSQLKAAINTAITSNGQNEITGALLNQVLTAMVNSLGAGYHCMGVATPSTNPGSPDQNVFYFATEAGTYSNFSGIILQNGISVLLWNGTWTSQTWFTIDTKPTSGSTNFVMSKGVYEMITGLELVDNAGSALQPTEKDIVLRYNRGTEEEPDYVNIASLVLSQADDTHAGLMPAKNLWKIVRVDAAQSFTDAEKQQARTNIGADTKADEIAVSEIDKIDLVDVTGSALKATQKTLHLRHNEGTEEEPDYNVLSSLVIGQATDEEAGLLPAKSEWDDVPTKDSNKLVKSGGIFNNIGAFDISEYYATENPHTLATYADLNAALSALPTNYRKGGMSIKFVQSSDNKYVQYRLMSSSFNRTVANWQGVDDEPTADSDNLVTSGGVLELINAHEPKNPYISNELLSKNFSNVVRNKFIKYIDSSLQILDNDLCSYVKIPIPENCKTLFISGDGTNIFSVTYGCLFVNYNNEYISEGMWSSINCSTLGIMPDTIPDNAAFVYINYLTAKEQVINIYCGLPFVTKDRSIIGCDISEVTNCELFYKEKTIIHGHTNSNLQWAINANFGLSTPIECYEGDVFKINNWCGSVYQPSAYSRNIVYFNENAEFVGTDTIQSTEYELTIPSDVSYVSFLFEFNLKNTFTIKRVKSGSLLSNIGPDISKYDETNDNIEALKIKGVDYNIHDALLDDIDNDILKNATWIKNKYINTSGEEVSYSFTSYTHISISGHYGYIIGDVENWSNLQNIIIFKNGDAVIGYSYNDGTGIQYGVYGVYQPFVIPDGTTDIYINVTEGLEDKVKLYINSEEITFSNVQIIKKYLNENCLSTKECKLAWNRDGGYGYYRLVRSCFPVKVAEGEVYKYNNWSTNEILPTAISTVYIYF